MILFRIQVFFNFIEIKLLPKYLKILQFFKFFKRVQHCNVSGISALQCHIDSVTVFTTTHILLRHRYYTTLQNCLPCSYVLPRVRSLPCICCVTCRSHCMIARIILCMWIICASAALYAVFMAPSVDALLNVLLS